MKITNFKDLEVWKESIELTKEIYTITLENKFSRDFGLCDQIRRAVVSISSNIVEGFEKNNNNEFSRYLRIAKGSVGEVRSQLEVSYAVGYINEKRLSELDDKLVILAAKIGALLQYLQNQRLTRNTQPVTRNL